MILLWGFVLKHHGSGCRRLRLHNAFNLITLVNILPLLYRESRRYVRLSNTNLFMSNPPRSAYVFFSVGA